MNEAALTLSGITLIAMGSGALWWPEQSLLCVSDLHLGKSARMAQKGGAMLPPYEIQDTLTRLARDLDRTGAKTVVCLGDSFDDVSTAKTLPDSVRLWIAKMQAGRRWVWIEGNHDPGPVDLGGSHLAELAAQPITFRHIAVPEATGEISGHYHPKAKIQTSRRTIARRAFLLDQNRLIMPAYGTYTGGLLSNDSALTTLMGQDAIAVLTGQKINKIPMPR